MPLHPLAPENAQSSWHSWRNASSRGRFTIPQPRLFSPWWRVTLVGLALLYVGLNLSAEIMIAHAYKTKGLSPQSRLDILTNASLVFPFDLNIRMAAYNFAVQYNRLFEQNVRK
jgi:hypothetical protein